MSRRYTPNPYQYAFDFDSLDESPKPENTDISERLITYISLASGSSGNSCYLGTKRGGVLIDAGIKVDEIEARLKNAGISMDQVRAILLTHDHSDHVRFAYTVLRKYKHLHVYCTNRVLSAMLRKHSISRRIKDFHIPIFKEIPFKVLDFEVTAFDVPHDGFDNMGFSFEFDGRKFVIATDLGEIQPRAQHYLSAANYMVIEANYDLQMLADGPYPEYLKARIRTPNGHMQNEATAQFLASIVGPHLSHVFLCHLSADNNTPELALSAVRASLEAKGLNVGGCDDTIADRNADICLMALPRHDATRKFVFHPKS